MSNNTCVIPGNVVPIIHAATPEGDSTRYGCTVGVKVSATADGYRCEATDGRIAAVITGPNMEAMPEQPEFRRKGGEHDNACLECDNFAGIIGYPPHGQLVDFDGEVVEDLDWKDRNITVAIGGSQSVIATRGKKQQEGLQLREVTNIEGRFPDILKVIPKTPPTATATARVDAGRLIQLLKVAEAVQGDGGVSLELHNTDKGGLVIIRVRNIEGQEMVGILVQLVPSTDPKIT